jgi:hypothetical protein
MCQSRLPRDPSRVVVTLSDRMLTGLETGRQDIIEAIHAS